MVKVGDKLKDFTIKDQNGKDIKLSELKGQKVLLSFHPLAFTSVCANQMKSLEENFAEFQKLNTVPLGVSVDSVPTKRAWAKELSINNTRLVSDFWPHGGLAKELGIFMDKDGVSQRVNILLDENGTVIWMKVYPLGEVPDIKEVLEVIKSKSKS